ncbi:adenylate cyclase [Streptomyces sp. NWU49]|uniref:CYTH domain-containing protein n=1 Tax=Streptomyces sp. NWU49 TaxID=2201153 RepID=UPI000D684BD4|nr:CYTH domain-containing protein [Streptomyces sp. NWU49]PWJ02351.1 adenylate cyclase [Streptomyces sp. NWU49]
MSVEIERKYVVVSNAWRSDVDGGERMRQGYLAVPGTCSVRVRVRGEAAWLCVKGPRQGDARSEFEYPVPLEDAQEMLRDLCGDRLIDKTRYRCELDGFTIEVDEFSGANDGLVLAEVELPQQGMSLPDLPDWIGPDVTKDDRYYNSHLSRDPYREWALPSS